MNNGYVIDEIATESEWQPLFARANFCHMTQSWAFGEAKRATRWLPRRFAIRRDGEPVAICQALDRTVAKLRILARINLGPMLLTGHTQEAMEVLQALRGRWRLLGDGVLFIAPAVAYSDEAMRSATAMGFRQRNQFRWASSRLNLNLDETELRRSLASTWRNRLKNSERHGLQFVGGNAPAEVEWMVQKHQGHVKEKGFEAPSPKLLRSLYQAAPNDFLVFRALYEGQPVAGMVAYRFGTVAHYYVGWFGPDGRRLNAGNFLFWNAALELKRLGCTQFDLGGHNTTSGFGAFKLGMCGEPYQLLGEFISL